MVGYLVLHQPPVLWLLVQVGRHRIGWVSTLVRVDYHHHRRLVYLWLPAQVYFRG